jgi:hypothetical protein
MPKGWSMAASSPLRDRGSPDGARAGCALPEARSLAAGLAVRAAERWLRQVGRRSLRPLGRAREVTALWRRPKPIPAAWPPGKLGSGRSGLGGRRTPLGSASSLGWPEAPDEEASIAPVWGASESFSQTGCRLSDEIRSSCRLSSSESCAPRPLENRDRDDRHSRPVAALACPTASSSRW